VDAGPDVISQSSPEFSWNLLCAQLAQHELIPSNIKKVLITHEHIDHAGLASRWAKEGATILVHPEAISTLTKGIKTFEDDRENRFSYLVQRGVPSSIVDEIKSQTDTNSMRWIPCPETALHPISDQQEIMLRNHETLVIHHAPGHTRGNLVAVTSNSKLLFSGDTVLEHTIPTAGLHLDRESLDAFEPVQHWPSLPLFIQSVKKLAQTDIQVIYPGHGTAIYDPDKAFNRFILHHSKRAEKVTTASETVGTDNPYLIAKHMFPRLGNRRLAQAMIEIIGHQDLKQAQELN
jgi:hydroxyacylglutathione hydrolase